MKYFLIAKKDNVIKIIPFKESYVYSSSDDSLFYEDTLLIKNIDGASIYKISDNLIQIFDTEKGYYYLNDRFNVVKSNFYIIPNKKYKFLIAQASPIRISMGVYKKSIYFLNENLTNEEGLIIDDNYNDLITYTEKILILGNRNELYGYNIQPFNPLWHYDLGTKYNYKEADYQGEPPVEVQAEVIKFLGVYKNELWLVLNSGLLALNIETGTETRYIKEGKMAVGEPFFEDFKGYFGYDTFLDEEKGIIFSLNLHFYIEYDLNSNKNHFDSYSFKASSEKNGLHLNQIGGYDTENIYAYEGSDNNRFAIFSREKKEIIWSEEIPESKDKFPAIRDLQYGAGKIYVLDHYNTLHIFDRGE